MWGLWVDHPRKGHCNLPIEAPQPTVFVSKILAVPRKPRSIPHDPGEDFMEAGPAAGEIAGPRSPAPARARSQIRQVCD